MSVCSSSVWVANGCNKLHISSSFVHALDAKGSHCISWNIWFMACFSSSRRLIKRNEMDLHLGGNDSFAWHRNELLGAWLHWCTLILLTIDLTFVKVLMNDGTLSRLLTTSWILWAKYGKHLSVNTHYPQQSYLSHLGRDMNLYSVGFVFIFVNCLRIGGSHLKVYSLRSPC